MRRTNDVLFLCQYFYPEYISSATLPYDTAMAYVNAGFNVSVLCGYPKEYNESKNIKRIEIHNGIKIKRLKYIQLKRNNFFGRLINYFSFTFMVFLNFLHLRKFKSIIVYSNPPILPLIASWASKLFKVKMIFVSYDVYPEIAHVTKAITEDGLISKTMKYINKNVFLNVDSVVVLSNEMKDYLINNRKDLSEKQVVVIPNWYEDKSEGMKTNSYFNQKFIKLNPRENLIISYFGNLGVCQDIETILGAIRGLSNENDIQFLFAGHGSKLEYLKETVNREELKNVVIYDFLHGDDFQDALNISDCFVVSLIEGITGLAVPSKTYSYMMGGKPIIAIMDKNTDIARDIVNNKAGFSLNVGEVGKLIDSIKILKDNTQLREEMGQNISQLYRKNYTTEISTNKYVKMLKDILEEN